MRIEEEASKLAEFFFLPSDIFGSNLVRRNDYFPLQIVPNGFARTNNNK
jgi:hypothetical protein